VTKPANARRGAVRSNRRRNPDRISTPPITPSKPTPRPGPVDARVPDVAAAAGAAMVVAVEPAVTGAAVVVGAGALVVAVVGGGAPVVVVAAGAVSPAKRIVPVPLSLAWSPYVSVQTSPAACWAAVGGHGYSAASAVGLPPPSSVAGQVSRAGGGPHGGPTVPWTTLNVVDNAPVELVATSADNEIAVQLTDTGLLTGAGRTTLGCLGSELHSRTFPGDPWAKPLPVIVTDSPPVNPVLGVMVMGMGGGVAAYADNETPTIATPETKLAAATNARCLDAPRGERRRLTLTLFPLTLAARTDKKSPPGDRPQALRGCGYETQ
jgi:hypothetical protein